MTAGRALPRAFIVARHDVTPGLFVLRLRPEAPLVFVPGQYCTIGLDGVERPYSIVSAPHEPLLELVVEVVEHGALTPRLARLRAGDVVSLRPRAKGSFTLDAAARAHLMVATVTGIAPFVSMLRDAVHHGEPAAHFVVLHGASHHDELLYADELRTLAAAHPGIVYVPTVSRPTDPRNRSWPGATGRVHTLVEAALSRFSLTPRDTATYACGHPGMIHDVTQILEAKAFAVHQERFWVDEGADVPGGSGSPGTPDRRL